MTTATVEPDPVVARPPRPTLAELTAPGWAALRRYWRPFLLLQGIALLLVVGYYAVPDIRLACDRLAEFKTHAGLAFVAVTAAASGAFLPEAAKAVMLGDRRLSRQRFRDIGFAAAAFALSGVITDLQYRGLARAFGSGTGPATVIVKVLADQLVTTPLYGLPYWLVVYALRADRYRVHRTVRRLTPAWYARTVLPLMLANWAFWFPMSALIYALPSGLQFCLFLLAVSAWSLLMVFVASGQAARETLPVGETGSREILTTDEHR